MKTAPTLKPEDRISHYRVIGPLGAGGMGEVYRAKDETLERDVALKILPPALVRSEERLRRFVLEAKSASSLNHPHIVTIYEIGQAEVDSVPVHFISMELVTGETLTTKIHGEHTGLKTLLGWLAQAAEGLAKAHAAGIVHRDLKPGNIMVSRDGYAKVLDFGLAKLTERQVADGDRSAAPTMTEELTSDGMVLGTVGYMSPEQVQGKPVDHRSDIFSFGCILYEAATRKRPFAGDSFVETMHKILKDNPAPIEELNAEAPAELRRLIRRCLAKDPNQRLDSMKALAIELREIADEYDALSASASSGSGARPVAPAKRRVATLPLVAVGGVLAVVAVLAGMWVMRRGEGQKTNTSFQSMKMTTLPGHGDVSSAALSPDGRYLASVSGTPERTSIWMRQVTTGSVVEVFHGTTPPAMLTFARDGEHLFFVSPDPQTPVQGLLYEIPVLGGTPVKRGSNVDSAITLAPDGTRACFLRHWPNKKRDELVILDLKSGQERILSTIHQPAILISRPAWSPDGQRIAAGEATVESGALKRTVVMFRASDGRREVVPTDSMLWVQDLVWLPDGSGLVISAGSPPDFHGELWFLPYPGGGVRRITNDPSVYFSLSISSDGTVLGAIRFVSILNIWTADARAGGAVRQLTSATTQENAPLNCQLSPDGSVVFKSSDAAHPLWRIEADGAAVAPLTAEGLIGSFATLPDRGVVYTRVGEDRVNHIWRVDSDGPPRQVTFGNGEALVGISPDWQTLLFWPTEAARFGETWTVPVNGGEPRRLFTSYASDVFPVYSPDGSHIGYRDLREVGGKPQFLCKVIPSTGGDPIATLPLGADREWTADGKALTYLDAVNGVANVFRQPLDGSTPVPITHFTENEIRDHEWSPDGRRLLMVRGNGKIENVWMTAADGSEAVQLTDFKTGRITGVDWVPPDGRRFDFYYGQESTDVVLIKNFR